MRDMTRQQFLSALQRYGMRNEGIMGYVAIGHGVSVSRHNAGANFRAQLAYLIREQERVNAEFEARVKVDNTQSEVSK